VRSLKVFHQEGGETPFEGIDTFERVLSRHQRKFVTHYLTNPDTMGNARKSAAAAGYLSPGHAAVMNMRNPAIRAAIDNALKEAGVNKDDIVGFLKDIMNGDLSDVLDVSENGKVSLAWERAMDMGKTSLVKGMSLDGNGQVRRIEIHDAHKAAVDLAKIGGFYAEGSGQPVPVVVQVIKRELGDGPIPDPEDVIDVEAVPMLNAPESENP
jgi:hypothetical protein